MLIVTIEGNKYYEKLSKKMESVESGYYASYNRQMAGYNHKLTDFVWECFDLWIWQTLVIFFSNC